MKSPRFPQLDQVGQFATDVSYIFCGLCRMTFLYARIAWFTLDNRRLRRRIEFNRRRITR
jgi:hypothetical protein